MTTGGSSDPGGGGATGGAGGAGGSGGPICVGPPLQGSFTIHNAVDVMALQAYSEVTGDLNFDAAGVTSISLPNLCAVGGKIGGNDSYAPNLQTLDLPALTSAGSIGVAVVPYYEEFILPSLTTLAAPNLETAPNGVVLRVSSPQLAALDFPKITATSLLTIQAEVGCEPAISAPLLTNANINVQTGGPASSLDLPALVSSNRFLITGSFSTIHADALISMQELWLCCSDVGLASFAALISAGMVKFNPGANCPRSMSCTPFVSTTVLSAPALTQVGLVELGTNGGVGGIDLPSLTTVGGTFDLIVNGTPSVMKVGAPTIANNATITVTNWPGGSLDIVAFNGFVNTITSNQAFSLPELLSTTNSVHINVYGAFSAPKLASAESLTISSVSTLNLSSLSTASSFYLTGSTLGNLSLPSLTTLTNGLQLGPSSFCTSGNTQLVTLNFPSLTSLGVNNSGTMNFGHDPLLPMCRAQALAEQLTMAGWSGTANYWCPLTTGPCP